jgi:hypothetical protein
MEKEFIPYEQALALKELGFDEPCFGYYEPNKKFEYLNWETFKDFPYLAKNSEWQDLYGAPLYQQAFRWFREKHKLSYSIYPYIEQFKHSYLADIYNGLGKVPILTENRVAVRFYTYEEAESACLKKLIEICKNK